jgi:hypothetical protein
MIPSFKLTLYVRAQLTSGHESSCAPKSSGRGLIMIITIKSVLQAGRQALPPEVSQEKNPG